MNNPLLAIETSDLICGACIYFNDDKYFSSKVTAKHSHSEKLFEVIENVFKDSGISKSDIDSIAVSAGPGSFTGLRIGMSAAKGLATGLSIPITPVPTFEALAQQLSAVHQNEEIAIANKINRDEVYFAKFYLKMNSYIFTEGLKILQNSDLKFIDANIRKFGSAFNQNQLSAPEPESVAKWAAVFGEKFKTNDIDNLEPNYLKNFIVKERKNA